MIREIINFVKDLERDYPEVFEMNKKPSPGLHLWVELDEEGNWKNNPPEEGKDYVVYDGNAENLMPIEKKAVLYQEVQDYLTMNKQQKFDKKQKIHSTSPFAISFNFSLNDTDKENNGIKKKPDKDDVEENQKKIISTKLDFVLESVPDFFNNARKTILLKDDVELNNYSKLLEKLYPNIISAISELTDKESKNILQRCKEKDYVRIYLKNVSIERQRELHEKYVTENVFNKDVYNIKSNEETFGVADFMTTFGSKKPFLSHKTSFFIKEINARISNEEALKLSKFEELKKAGVLPNPLPIFIDKNEFKNNSEIISVFNNEGERKFTYPQLLKKIYEKNEQRILGNYYLLNMSRGVVNDFDFVSNFQYQINHEIKNLFKIKRSKEELPSIKLHSIFGFENIVVCKIFNNALVREKNGEFSYNYFNDIDPNYVSGGEVMANTILRFRKAFYDFIYKSRKQAITSNMFDEIMLTSIFCDIKQDEVKDGYHSKETSIKEKLNIWFSLYNNFSKQSKNRENMANTFKTLLDRMELIANEDNILLEENNIGEFLFAAGQVIYFLLSKSKTSNPTHALLEPFLQKSNAIQLQNAIANAVNAYKHEISFYKDRFERLAGQVLAYETKENLKNYQRYLLAGYFAPAIIYKSTKEKELQEASNN
jgi:CRISPR-associated protein Csh1